MRKETETREHYFITTPYIDAYKVDVDVGATWTEFERFMKCQAVNWGETGLGRAVLLGLELPKHENEYVLAFGEWGKSRYVATGTHETIHLQKVGSFPEGWNVT